MKKTYLIIIIFITITSLLYQGVLYALSPKTDTAKIANQWNIIFLILAIYDLYGFMGGRISAKTIDSTEDIKRRLKQKLRINGKLQEYEDDVDRINDISLGKDGIIYVSYTINGEKLLLRFDKSENREDDYIVISESDKIINDYRLQIVTRVNQVPPEPAHRGYLRREFLGGAFGFLLAFGIPKTIRGTEASIINVRTIVNWIIRNIHGATRLPPSYTGDQRWHNAGFLYDHAVASLLLNITGERAGAEAIIDYYKRRYDIDPARLQGLLDQNHVYGILRVLPDIQRRPLKGIINAADIADTSSMGTGREWYVDGGPQYWLAISMLQVNRDKYLGFSEALADFGLRLQDADGGIRSGPRGQKTNERELNRFELKYTEHNIDAYALFKMLYEITGNEKYKKGMNGILNWLKRVYKRNEGYFYQGSDHGRINDQFATDAQAWSICAVGPETLDQLLGEGTADKLIESLEKRSLVRISYQKGAGEIVSVTGFDFSDPRSKYIVNQREGYRPVVTPEWSSQAALAYYEMASYSWKRGKRRQAVEYKAKGDALVANIMGMAKIRGNMSFLPYASQAGVPTGFGWNTSNAYASIAGTWVVFPARKYNPFILGGGGLPDKLESIPVLQPRDANRLLYSAVPADKKDIGGSLADHYRSVNPRLIEWLKQNRNKDAVKVIDYYFEDGKWAPYKVEYKEDYTRGINDKGELLTASQYRLSEEEQGRLNKTLHENTYDEVGRPVRFRVVLDETTVAWMGDIDHSSLVHAGERTGTVWFGEGLFRDLLSKDRDPLRKKIFGHEKEHLTGHHSIDQGDEYNNLVREVYNRCREIEGSTKIFRLYKRLHSGIETAFLEWEEERGAYLGREEKLNNEETDRLIRSIERHFPKNVPGNTRRILAEELIFMQKNIFPAMSLKDMQWAAKKTSARFSFIGFIYLFHFIDLLIVLILILTMGFILGDILNSLLLFSIFAIGFVMGFALLPALTYFIGMKGMNISCVSFLSVIFSAFPRIFLDFKNTAADAVELRFTFIHELVHLYTLKHKKRFIGNILATAFDVIRCTDLSGQVAQWDFYKSYFNEGTKTIKETPVQERLHRFRPIKLSSIIEVFGGHKKGFFLAGMAYQISRETGDLNDAYTYLRLLYLGFDFITAELIVRSEAIYRKRNQRKIDANISCGTVCESGHEGSYWALDEQLKRQFNRLKEILGVSDRYPAFERKARGFITLSEYRFLSEEEADKALVEYVKRFGLAVTIEQLQGYRSAIKTAIREYISTAGGMSYHSGAKEVPSVYFAVPETGTELFWVGRDYTGGHINWEGNRIHISLPVVIKYGVDAGAVIGLHEINHKLAIIDRHKDDSGLKVVREIAEKEMPEDGTDNDYKAFAREISKCAFKDISFNKRHEKLISWFEDNMKRFHDLSLLLKTLLEECVALPPCSSEQEKLLVCTRYLFRKMAIEGKKVDILCFHLLMDLVDTNSLIGHSSGNMEPLLVKNILVDCLNIVLSQKFLDSQSPENRQIIIGDMTQRYADYLSSLELDELDEIYNDVYSYPYIRLISQSEDLSEDIVQIIVNIVLNMLDSLNPDSVKYYALFEQILIVLCGKYSCIRKHTWEYFSKKIGFYIDCEADSPQDALSYVFSDTNVARKFLELASVMRCVYPYDISKRDPRPPLQYALEEKIYAKIGRDLYMTPVSESFRRHIIFKWNEREGVLFAFEVIIPGQDKSKLIIGSEMRQKIAEELINTYPEQQYCPNPIFNMGLPAEEYRMYGKNVRFGYHVAEEYIDWRVDVKKVKYVDRPLQIFAFDYPHDGKRLGNITRQIREELSRQWGIPVIEIEKDIIGQVSELVIAIHLMGYAGHEGDREDGEILFDLSIDNMRFVIDRRNRKINIILAGDFQGFAELSEIHKYEDIVLDYKAVFTGLDGKNLPMGFANSSAMGIPSIIDIVGLSRAEIYRIFRKRCKRFLDRQSRKNPKLEMGCKKYMFAVKEMEKGEIGSEVERPAVYEYDEEFWQNAEMLNPGILEKVKRIIATYFDTAQERKVLWLDERLCLKEGVDYDFISGRSVIIRLNVPIEVNGVMMREIAVKGAPFKKSEEGKEYNPYIDTAGEKGCHIEFDPDGLGRMVPLRLDRKNAIFYDEAKNEYRIGRIGFKDDRCPVNILPVMNAGYLDDEALDGGELGVVVTASPSNTTHFDSDTKNRAGHILGILFLKLQDSLSKPESKQNSKKIYADIASLMGAYGSTLRKFHDAGYIHGNPHSGNVVVDMDTHKVHVVDLTDARLKSEMTFEQAFGYQLRDILYAAGDFMDQLEAEGGSRLAAHITAYALRCFFAQYFGLHGIQFNFDSDLEILQCVADLYDFVTTEYNPDNPAPRPVYSDKILRNTLAYLVSRVVYEAGGFRKANKPRPVDEGREVLKSA